MSRRRAHGGVEGLQLAVQVGGGHRVAVHHRQLPHAGSGQALRGIAPHAAKAEQNHMGAGKARLPLPAPEHFVAQKLMFHSVPFSFV